MVKKNILIFGAGKIGRSFIGQIFGRAGYTAVFIDQDASLVKALKTRGSYPVIIKGPEREDLLSVKPVRAMHASKQSEINQAIVDADIIAVSVGKSALTAVASALAQGLLLREEKSPGRKLDVILAENMRSANLFFYEALKELLPKTYPLDELVGLVETSIGKMVPIMTRDELKKDPLQVFAEPYNTLILDKKGFKGRIPDIKELSLKKNMKAWVDRKAFIHNLGHASAAYYGHMRNAGQFFMYEVLAEQEVFDFTRRVMMESALILHSVYPDEFTLEDLELHIDDLLSRFQNRNLRDTVFRVGMDLKRKLGAEDRFMGIIRLARSYNLSYGLILEAMAMGFHFKGLDEHKQPFPGDVEFHEQWNNNPDALLEEICGMDPSRDRELLNSLKENIFRIKS